MPKVGAVSRETATPRFLLAIDPGGGKDGKSGKSQEHVGWAEFEQTPDGWRCIRATEYDKDQAADLFAAQTFGRVFDTVVIERFVLYPDAVSFQVGSDFPASQLIGVLCYLVRIANGRHRQDGLPEIELVMQPAAVQHPKTGAINAYLAKHGVSLTSVTTKAGGHAKSAELHGWHHIVRTTKQKVAGT